MSRLTGPPHDVPTLTEVVPAASCLEPAFSAAIAPVVASAEMQELMVQRVLRRIDLTLERRLQETIEQVILAHTHALTPRLREEIELVVRESVTQAFEQELASSPIQPKNQ